jgi:hypothetical protein
MSRDRVGFKVTPVRHKDPVTELPGTVLAHFTSDDGRILRLVRVATGYELRVEGLGRSLGILYGPADERDAWETYRWFTDRP